MLNWNSKVSDAIQDQPLLLEFLISKGFTPLKNPLLRKTLARQITLGQALASKNLDKEAFVKEWQKYCELWHNPANVVDPDSDFSAPRQEQAAKPDVIVQGVLPCPIQMPLKEAISKKVQELQAETNLVFDWDMRSANLGVAWMGDAPDVITSAGFEYFFSRDIQQRWLDTGLYSGGGYPVDQGLKELGADLRDPRGRYHIIGMVPTVFIVNKDVLGERTMPRSWTDLLKPEFANSIAIPRGDLDLFNAILLTLYAQHGLEAIKSLAANTVSQLHPSQMVGARGQRNVPCIQIAPYFFAQMIRQDRLQAVWPKDGAIVSPIFLLARFDRPGVREFCDILTSTEIASIFSLQGSFPTTAEGSSKELNSEQKFLFVGWDFLHEHPIQELIEELSNYFPES